MKETFFERKLVEEIKDLYPGAIILKTDPSYINGFPDRLTLLGNTWFAFETKKGINSRHRPNQDYYISLLNNMSYARFVFPENREDFLNEILATFRSSRSSRLSRS